MLPWYELHKVASLHKASRRKSSALGRTFKIPKITRYPYDVLTILLSTSQRDEINSDKDSNLPLSRLVPIGPIRMCFLLVLYDRDFSKDYSRKLGNEKKFNSMSIYTIMWRLLLVIFIKSILRERTRIVIKTISSYRRILRNYRINEFLSPSRVWKKAGEITWSSTRRVLASRIVPSNDVRFYLNRMFQGTVLFPFVRRSCVTIKLFQKRSLWHYARDSDPFISTPFIK